MNDVTQAAADLASAFLDDHAALTIEGRPVEVVAVTGREMVSELFDFALTCADEATAPPNDIPSPTGALAP